MNNNINNNDNSNNKITYQHQQEHDWKINIDWYFCSWMCSGFFSNYSVILLLYICDGGCKKTDKQQQQETLWKQNWPAYINCSVFNSPIYRKCTAPHYTYRHLGAKSNTTYSQLNRCAFAHLMFSCCRGKS